MSFILVFILICILLNLCEIEMKENRDLVGAIFK